MYQTFSRLPVLNLPRRCLGGHGVLGQAAAPAACPVGPVADTFDPTLNCQRDARGNAVCSDGRYFPPGCPHTPPDQYFSPGISPDEIHNGILEAKVPAPRAAGSTGGSGVSSAPGATAAPVGAGSVVGGLAVVGAVGTGIWYFFLR